MGDKNAARAAARKVGVPVTPGSDGIVQTKDEAMKIAKKLGYPVMIKAAGGGGGRGSALRIMSPALNPLSIARVMRRKKHLETMRCIWKSLSSIHATLNFKSWPIAMAT